MLNRNKVILDCWLAGRSGCSDTEKWPPITVNISPGYNQPSNLLPPQPPQLQLFSLTDKLSRNILRASLHRVLSEGRPEDNHTGSSPTRGKQNRALIKNAKVSWPGSDKGQRDGVCGRGGVLQGQQRHRQCGQRGERSPQHQVSGLLDCLL